MWTQFWDMHSGGPAKLHRVGTEVSARGGWGYNLDAIEIGRVYIEAPESRAIAEFIRRWGMDPREAACPTCGSNYSISEYPTLEEASEYERRDAYSVPPALRHGEGIPLSAYVEFPEVVVIFAHELQTAEDEEAPDYDYDYDYDVVDDDFPLYLEYPDEDRPEMENEYDRP